LALRAEGVRADHPSQAKLVDERHRGELLHFFGNHELLATELMALVLLKFPDAPASFRRGVLETLKEEQIHTRLYIHRMAQCGVEFGELPLSDYFWRSVSSMNDPLDYVTRLSLTFEQANLDYSREYGKIFNAVGDDATGRILEKIYHDEIDHVGFGLKWFRRWKAAGKTDWEAFRERLVFPLSPVRAKGPGFNAAGRTEAGLDATFIQELQVFQQSRGRTPSVYWFNPDAEQCAAQNAATAASSTAAALQHDLAFLPAFLSRQDDILVVPQRPAPEFLLQLQAAGFALPETLPVASGPLPKLERKTRDFRPWAWTPDSLAFFQENLTPAERDTLWNASRRALFAKSWSAAWGRSLAEASGDHPWMAPPEVYGRPAESLKELDALRADWARRGYPDLVCKAPFGTAARGLRCLRSGEPVAPALRAWLETVWEEQDVVMVEPWLERIHDFSVQMQMDADGLRTRAFTRLVNNPRGQFKGILTNSFTKGMEPALARFLMERREGRPRIYQWYTDELSPRLEKSLQEAGFNGPLGIDAFVYRDPSGQLRLKPMVEINPRYTMGRVAHELSERCAKTSVGFFQILTRAQLRQTGTPDPTNYAAVLRAAFPVTMTEEALPRLRSGSLVLNDPGAAKQFLAVFHVRENMDALPWER
jgi:uncharacterized ferritin-like protein (DUF455 family)